MTQQVRRADWAEIERFGRRGLACTVNSILFGIGGVFVATASVPVTAMAATAAVMITMLIVSGS